MHAHDVPRPQSLCLLRPTQELELHVGQVPRAALQKDAVFQYGGHEGHAFKVTVPEFTVAPGEVVAVVGRVGAGKSAVLQALLGNMPLKKGSMRIGGSVAYVPQVCASK
jgi:ABC-type transport system involved in cytochrome bd biosynthesis fused ATPase/permease subunit